MVTLSALSGQKIAAHVILIDPEPKMNGTIPTYKVTLQFNAKNDLIKPGMVARVAIETNHKENVIAIPARAIIKEMVLILC